MQIQEICAKCDTEVLISVEYDDYEAWRNGELIQNAMPYLTAEQREILISSICGDCFDLMFPED
jgi:hypothetical protein